MPLSGLTYEQLEWERSGRGCSPVIDGTESLLERAVASQWEVRQKREADKNRLRHQAWLGRLLHHRVTEISRALVNSACADIVLPTPKTGRWVSAAPNPSNRPKRRPF
jgi:hypothetical protein